MTELWLMARNIEAAYTYDTKQCYLTQWCTNKATVWQNEGLMSCESWKRGNKQKSVTIITAVNKASLLCMPGCSCSSNTFDTESDKWEKSSWSDISLKSSNEYDDAFIPFIKRKRLKNWLHSAAAPSWYFVCFIATSIHIMITFCPQGYMIINTLIHSIWVQLCTIHNRNNIQFFLKLNN